MNFPPHKCGLYLSHNAHKDYYETIEEYLMRPHNDFTKEEKDECIKAGELWELQWYPETPVGFHVVIGATLESVLEKASEE